MALQIAAAGALLLWVYLLLGRGGFWRMDEDQQPADGPVPAPSVAIIIPARNEADVIGRAVGSLAAQNYQGPFQIVVVDDHSSDGTADAARAAGVRNLTVVSAEPLAPGWTGKLWAVHQGVRAAAAFAPDYLLLTDADIVHSKENLSSLVAQAAAGQYELVSLMVRLHCRTLAERVLIPAFVFFFFLLYPPAWIRRPGCRTAAAAGGCMLIRYAALERIGGVETIRGELIDDCALARAVKQSGGLVSLGLTSHTVSIREYRGFEDIGRMISRSAFTQLRHSWFLLATTVAGLAFTYLLPAVSALLGNVLGAAAWLLMCLAYAPVLRFYKLSLFWAPLLPLVALFYTGATIHSALAWGRGRGGLWKGRVQAGRK